jgi:integrase/recombinase XerD
MKLYACGLRVSEATALEVGAIDPTNQVLRIVGKGKKERLVPLPQPILDELGHLWLTHHNRRWLFPNRRRDAPINKHLLSDTVAAAVAVAAIQRRVKKYTVRLKLCIPTSVRSKNDDN